VTATVAATATRNRRRSSSVTWLLLTKSVQAWSG
jgi:hypothetical protein